MTQKTQIEHVQANTLIRNPTNMSAGFGRCLSVQCQLALGVGDFLKFHSQHEFKIYFYLILYMSKVIKAGQIP